MRKVKEILSRPTYDPTGPHYYINDNLRPSVRKWKILCRQDLELKPTMGPTPARKRCEVDSVTQTHLNYGGMGWGH